MSSEKFLTFVVHKHKARALHYDVRLEIGGVMPSWSVPKGPSLDHKVKRLAMVTEDHNLEYRHFEGIVPDGKYGIGIVMIWDKGFYWPELEVGKGKREEVQNIEEAELLAIEDLKKGNLKFRLYGEKLQGSFALVRTKGFKGNESWLLLKHHDKYCIDGYDAKDHDYSAESGRSMKEIGES